MPKLASQPYADEPVPLWTEEQRRFLDVLAREENRRLTVTKLCRAAGYYTAHPWYAALTSPRFVAEVRRLRGDVPVHRARISTDGWSVTEQRFLAVLAHEEHRTKNVRQICALAGYDYNVTWYIALENPRFVETVEALGVSIKPGHTWAPAHTAVTLATDLEAELAEDVWDMRRIKPDYPKHMSPGIFLVNFTTIANLAQRVQVKAFLRAKLPRWQAATFSRTLYRMRPLLDKLPLDVDISTLTRAHIEAVLPALLAEGDSSANKALTEAKAMFTFMATAPGWSGPRPPRFLIWPEDIPSEPRQLPRPIPPDVVTQLDMLLAAAAAALAVGEAPPALPHTRAAFPPMLWDAIIVLRHTGMRLEDLAHLREPGARHHQGCLDQDPDGYWWIRIDYSNTKMRRDHRIPTRLSDGVVDAIRRQQARIAGLPDHFGGEYLFRTTERVLNLGTMASALERLAPLLLHEGQPYVITPHQFRHTIATDMIDKGVDIYTVKEFLGHSTLAMTERYVKVYLSSLKAKHDAYRARAAASGATALIAAHVVSEHAAAPLEESDGGWVPGRVGQLYKSPLPSGEGNCHHLAMLDPCPTPPVCGTCAKLHADKRHLPTWERKVDHLRLTVEALRANPVFARALQKHEQELRHAEYVVETITQEGYWDGRIHNTNAPGPLITIAPHPRRAVSAERANEIGAGPPSDA